MLHDVACSPDEVAVFHSLYTAFIWCHAPNGITSFPELNGHHTRPFGQIPDSDSSWRICIGKTLFFSMLHPHNYKAAGGGHAIARSHRSSAPAGRICRTAFIYSLASTVDQPSNQSASWTWECKLQEHLITISSSVPSLWIEGKNSESLQRTYTLITKKMMEFQKM